MEILVLARFSRSVQPKDVNWAVSTGRRNTLLKEVVMTRRKREPERFGRAAMRSPGRPGVARREERSRFWALIAAGRSSEGAAVENGVSQPVGFRWFREASLGQTG